MTTDKSMEKKVDEMHAAIVGTVDKPGLLTLVAIHGWALKAIGAVATIACAGLAGVLWRMIFKAE
jgi:hypothetical protein